MVPGEPLLNYARSALTSFVKSHSRLLFIPYAKVDRDYDSYCARFTPLFHELGLELESIHQKQDLQQAIKDAQIILVVGGNTFLLLKTLQDKNLLSCLRNKIASGGSYIGISAGTVIACPTICTTNDMPIVELSSLKSLGFIPFQINAHYTEQKLSGHGGETRDERINEYLIQNQQQKVLGLREGSGLLLENGSLNLVGKNSAKKFEYQQTPIEIQEEDQLNQFFKITP